jgi:hypothetical protein
MHHTHALAHGGQQQAKDGPPRHFKVLFSSQGQPNAPFFPAKVEQTPHLQPDRRPRDYKATRSNSFTTPPLLLGVYKDNVSSPIISQQQEGKDSPLRNCLKFFPVFVSSFAEIHSSPP